MIEIERVSDSDRLDSLRPEWDELLQASAANTVFLSWEWLSTWWKHLGGDRRLLLLAVRDGGELVGLAPLCLAWRRLALGVGSRVVEFLGTGSVGSDYLDVVARRGRERRVAEAVAQHLAHDGALLRLSYVRGRDASAAALGAELHGRGWGIEASKTDVCPYIPLAGHTWESYLATLGREHRYAVRRKLRAFERHDHARLDEVRSEEERREALAILVRLHLARWKGRGGSDAFDTPKVVAFHDEFTRLALARGWLRLFVLRLDGAPAAALYGLRYGRTFFFYQSGFDPAFAHASPGLVCLALTIRQAIEGGAEEYDLLRGAEPYKRHWAREVRLLGRLDLFPPRMRGLVWRQALRLGRSARSLGRRIRAASIGSTAEERDPSWVSAAS